VKTGEKTIWKINLNYINALTKQRVNAGWKNLARVVRHGRSVKANTERSIDMKRYDLTIEINGKGEETILLSDGIVKLESGNGEYVEYADIQAFKEKIEAEICGNFKAMKTACDNGDDLSAKLLLAENRSLKWVLKQLEETK
jgi:F0F1-type ATP synthase gamma subunit